MRPIGVTNGLRPHMNLINVSPYGHQVIEPVRISKLLTSHKVILANENSIENKFITCLAVMHFNGIR